MEENAQAGGMPPIAPLGGPVPSFKDIMGFEAVGMAEVMYEDDENDDTIPNIQVCIVILLCYWDFHLRLNRSEDNEEE